MIKQFSLSTLGFDSFKGINSPEVDSEDSNFVIPSGAVFSNEIKEDKFKRVNLTDTKKKLLDGDILFNTGGVGTLGRSGYFLKSNFSEGNYFPDSFIFVLRNNNPRVYPKYIFYALQTLAIKNQIHKKIIGTTGITSIKPAEILNLEVPIPLNKEGEYDHGLQEQTVDLLDSIQFIRNRYEKINSRMIDLTQAIFLNMFGDPISNSKKWLTEKLGLFAAIKTGNTPSRSKPEFYGDYIEWIKSDNINQNEFYPKAAKEYLSKLGLGKGRFVEKDSILMTCIAGSINSIGNVCVTNRKVAFNQQINGITITDETNLIFLYALLQNSKELIHRKANNVLKYILNKSALEKLELIRPPLALQNKFASIVLDVEKNRQKQQLALKRIEDLFESSLSKYTSEGLNHNEHESTNSAKWTAKDWFNLKQGVATILERWNRGEMVVEKLLYFLQQIKSVNFQLNFTRQNFGPYDSKVKSVLNARDKYFERKTLNGYPVFAMSTLGKEKLLKYDGALLKQARSAVIELAKEIDGKSSSQIEIIATICKLIEDLGTIDLSAIESELKTWKDKNVRFSPEQIKAALDFIIAKQWHLKLLK